MQLLFRGSSLSIDESAQQPSFLIPLDRTWDIRIFRYSHILLSPVFIAGIALVDREEGRYGTLYRTAPERFLRPPRA